MDESLQIFVSYRSTNANEVRAVVDILLAHGVGVWFAEYQVLARNYDDFEKAIDREICDAIGRCTHGVVFTNQDWAKSEHCQNELERLLDQHGAGSRNLVQICMPREELSRGIDQALANITTYEHRWGDYTGTAKFIMQQFSPHIPFCRPPVLSRGNERKLAKFGYCIQLALGQYESQDREADDRFSPGNERNLLRQFIGTFEDVPLFLLVRFVPPTRRGGMEYPYLLSISENNRVHYHVLRRLANDWHISEEQGEKGLHFFLHHDRPQLAMTYLKRDGNRLSWQRMYVIHFGERTSALVGEVNLSFGMACNGKSIEADFRRFLRITPCLDAMASQLQYKGWSLLRRFTPWQMFIAGPLILGCVGVASTPSCREWRAQLSNGNWAGLLTTGDISRGEDMLASGRFEDAIIYFEQSIQIDPKSDKAFRLRCMARALSGHTSLALADGETATKLNPNESDNWVSLGAAKIADDQFVEAEEAFRKALELSSDVNATGQRVPHSEKELATAHGCVGRSVALLSQGNKPESRAALNDALRICPKYDFKPWAKLCPNVKDDIDRMVQESTLAR